MVARRRRNRRVRFAVPLLALIFAGLMFWASKTGALTPLFLGFGNIVGGWLSSLFLHGPK